MTTRRLFLTSLPVGALALGAGTARAAAVLTEVEPAAAALGYKMDATKVDAKKFPAYVSGRLCNGCQLYAGKPGDPSAPCAVFGGKVVNAKGWCGAWARKA